MKKREQLQESLRSNLEKYWGYESFRPMQLEAMESVCSGWDTLALMPTGAGKSLLYQLPALTMDGVCIVITPLVALMKDQVDRLRRMGISAAAIHSGLTTRQIDFTLDNAAWGDLKFLYIAPERIGSPTFMERIRTMTVSILAVDEAHCISQWGYDFRPSYLRIAELRRAIPNTPILALTASATPKVAQDILHNLEMREGHTIRSSFARPNLSFSIRRTDDKLTQLLRVVSNVEGSGIVYARTRDETEKLAKWLVEQGVDADWYHAGASYLDRSQKQDRWSKGECRVVVSTNAFGMGIDKANVRFVVHYDICDSLEAYYQEAGRAGRDGKLSYCVLLTGSDDLGRATRRFDSEFPPIDSIKRCYEALFNFLQIGIGDGKYATFNFNIYEFSARARIYSSSVFSALKVLQQNGYLTLTNETDNPPRIMFIVSRDGLYKTRIDREELDHFVRTILRLYSGLFSGRFVSIDEQEIAHASGYTPERVHELLQKLWKLHIIKYIPGSRSPMLILNEERLPQKDLYISPESYHMRKNMAIERLEAMYKYVENIDICRSAVMQGYFGEEDAANCGKCDVCLARKKESGEKDPVDVEKICREILDILHRDGAMSVKQIVTLFRTEPNNVIYAVDTLLDSEIIYVGADGKIEIKK